MENQTKGDWCPMTIGDFRSIQKNGMGHIEVTRLYISGICKFMDKRQRRRWRRRQRRGRG